MDNGVFQKVLTLIAADRKQIREDYQQAMKHAYMFGLSFEDKCGRELKNFPQLNPGCVMCGKEMEPRHLRCTVVNVDTPEQLGLLCEAGRYKECMSKVTFCLDCSGDWYGDQFAVWVTPGKRFRCNGWTVLVDDVSLINSKGKVLSYLKFGDTKTIFVHVN